MVYLSQLLRKDNFLTVEAIEEIISDKFEGFNYISLKNTFFLAQRKSKQKGKEEPWIGEMDAINMAAKAE